MKKKSFLASPAIRLLLFLSSFFISHLTAAEPTYSVTDLGQINPTAINDAGQVTGYTGTNHAFLYSAGVLTDLGLLGGQVFSQGRAINGSGEIAAIADVNTTHAFHYANGTATDLGSLGGGITLAYGINDAGHIVGSSTTSTLVDRAFIWSAGTMSDLGTPAEWRSAAIDINNSGQVAGFYLFGGQTRAFLYSGGGFLDIGTLGGTYSYATALNDSGDVVGLSETPEGIKHAFLYSNGVMRDLGIFGGASSIATGINNSGQIVGDGPLPFLYENGVMNDLSTLIPADSGWTLGSATAINNLGYIIGTGTHNGQQAAFLLTPLTSPPPSADLSLTLTDTPDPVAVGADLTYRLIVSNNGPDAATDITLTDTLPGGVSVVSMPPECTGTNPIVCNVGSMPAGTDKLVGIIVQATAAGSITNTASVQATENDPDSSNNTAGEATTVTNKGTVYLLLHGLNSDPSTWDTVVNRVFSGDCQTLQINPATTVTQHTCYRQHFSGVIRDGEVWPNGDGLTFQELADEVDWAINEIDKAVQPESIVLTGHSRGGLAGRAYLQTRASNKSFRIGLLTIGTPHQGSPLGRIKWWMDDNEIGVNDVIDSVIRVSGVTIGNPRDTLRFLFSPSTGYLATMHDPQGARVCDSSDPLSISYAICDLQTGVQNIPNDVLTFGTFGHIYSSGLHLGQNALLRFDLLTNLVLTRILPRLIPTATGSDFQAMRAFILENIAVPDSRGRFCNAAARRDPANWACNGDGIVPLASQLMTNLPGWNTALRGDEALNGVFHINETSEDRRIKQALKAMTNGIIGFVPP